MAAHTTTCAGLRTTRVVLFVCVLRRLARSFPTRVRNGRDCWCWCAVAAGCSRLVIAVRACLEERHRRLSVVVIKQKLVADVDFLRCHEDQVRYIIINPGQKVIR